MRHRVRFLLGDQLRELDQIDPTLTVLAWLRTVERRVGTKEGCAEGDCGACTVVIARPEGEGLRYRAVNACIQFVATLDGCQLLTVEDLKGPDGALHPAQLAMVECHGAQCGFCTPGFVMSLFALHRSEDRPGGDRIDDVLAGNLCRCTGYQPIVAAAQRMYDLGSAADDRFAAAEAAVVKKLRALADDQTIALTGPAGRFFSPASADALAELLVQHPEACIVAGATDVGLWVTKEQRRLDPVVYLGRVAELQVLTETTDTIEIGAAVTYTDAMATLARHYPDLGELLRRLASVQIRNLGTIGGNVANGSPIGDMPPALIVAGAAVHLRHGVEQRSLALEDFFIAYGQQDRRPGEFVERIILPKPAPGTRFRAYKVAKRFDQDITATLGAFSLRVEAGKVAAIRIAYGGMAATPKRASHAEAAMLGQPWTEATAAAGMQALTQDFSPITDMRASAGYRMRAAQNLIMRLLIETTDPSAETRLVGERSLAHA